MKIKILTYNFFQRPMIIKNNKSDFKDERVELFEKHFKNFDIICFQEIYGNFNKRKLKLYKLAFEKGFKYFSQSKEPGLFEDNIIDGGVVILSRYPIIKCDFNEFPFCVTIDGLTNKGILYAKILVEGKIINIFNTHAQASYPDKDISIRNKYLCCRYIQLFHNCKFIKSKMEEFKDNELVLYLGDFNIDSRCSPYNISTYNSIKDKLINFDKNIYFNSIKNNTISEYDLFINTMKSFFGNNITDIMMLENNKHLVTFGDITVKDNVVIPKETCLTAKDELMGQQCLDYIFILNNRNKTLLNYQKKSFKIEPFFEKSHEFITQLSDHYGLSIIIE